MSGDRSHTNSYNTDPKIQRNISSFVVLPFISGILVIPTSIIITLNLFIIKTTFDLRTGFRTFRVTLCLVYI